MQRIDMVGRQLVSDGASAKTTPKSDDDVVIVSAVRTALTKGKRGGFKDTHPEKLLSSALSAVVDRVKLDKALVQDIQVGNVLPPGGGATLARMSQFYAGFPETTSIATLNRQCSSGLQAAANIAGAIKAGYIDIGIGAGVESMTQYYESASYGDLDLEFQSVPAAADCLLPMGTTSENVAQQFGVTREQQDRFAAESHARAARAQQARLFDEEIVPVSTVVLDKDGNEQAVTVSADDGVRPGTTLESLSKLKPAFGKGGSTTAGNASQVSDGAAAVLLMRRSTAIKLGIKPLARFVQFAVVGVPPAIMGIGPAVAIPQVLKQAKLTKEDVDVYEINEAFASQAVYCVNKLGLDPAKVNPLGGAIAFGHPLGCTGARQIATILPELRRRKARFGVTSMCIGSGMGAAALIENEVL